MRRGPCGAVQVRDRADQEGEAAGRAALLDGAADGGLPPVRHAPVHRLALRRHRHQGEQCGLYLFESGECSVR